MLTHLDDLIHMMPNVGQFITRNTILIDIWTKRSDAINRLLDN